MKLKPITATVQFTYVCPKCGGIHYASDVEARVEGFKIVCWCDNILEPVQMAHITITPRYVEDVTKPVIENIQPRSNIIDSAKNVLRKQGFTNAENLVMSALHDSNKYTTINDLVKASLCYVNTD